MLVSTVGVCSGSMLVGGMKPEFIVAAVDLSVLDFPAVVVEQHVVNPAQQDSVVDVGVSVIAFPLSGVVGFSEGGRLAAAGPNAGPFQSPVSLRAISGWCVTSQPDLSVRGRSSSANAAANAIASTDLVALLVLTGCRGAVDPQAARRVATQAAAIPHAPPPRGHPCSLCQVIHNLADDDFVEVERAGACGELVVVDGHADTSLAHGVDHNGSGQGARRTRCFDTGK